MRGRKNEERHREKQTNKQTNKNMCSICLQSRYIRNDFQLSLGLCQYFSEHKELR
jgi:hypothetical protein